VPELLLELLSEEIPARMQARAAEDLKRLVTGGSAPPGSLRSRRGHVTPRRLVLVVDGLPRSQPDVTEERRGPRVDAPAQAIEGFLRSNGLTREQLRDASRTERRLFSRVRRARGRPTPEVLADLRRAIAACPGPSRCAGGGTIALGAAAAFASSACSTAGRAPCRSARSAPARSRGPPLPGPASVQGHGLRRLCRQAGAAKVILDRAERRTIIEQAARRWRKPRGCGPADPGLLDEVTGSSSGRWC
jgi:glycyl-tRNA synthetase beta chain